MSFKKSTVIALVCGLCVVLFFCLRGRIRHTSRTKSTIVSGQIIRGKRLGLVLGFPTANFEWPPDVSPPAYGVYAVKTDRGIGVMNFGVRPTVEDAMHPLAEVHLLNFRVIFTDKRLPSKLSEKSATNKNFLRQKHRNGKWRKMSKSAGIFLGTRIPDCESFSESR